MSNTNSLKKKTGPRGGQHSDDARQKMRDRWAERKVEHDTLLEIAHKTKEFLEIAQKAKDLLAALGI